jgi:splicing factor 1
MSTERALVYKKEALGLGGESKSSLVVYDEKFNRITPLDGRQRKRRRFSPGDEKSFIPPPFLDLAIGLSPGDVEQFFREQRLDDLTAKLSRADLELGDPDIRGPSPPPAYDKHGARTNSRETRVKMSMQKEYSRLVSSMLRKLSGYVAPTDYKPPKITMRVEIPQDRYQDVNFTGMILGPRGLNHKRLEDETGCQISIRGKGTRGQLESQTEEELAMPMHVCITGEDEERVMTAVRMIEPLVDPLHRDFEKERSRGLEQLALITGTGKAMQERQLRLLEADGIEEQSYTKFEILCSVCGDRGHLPSDCPSRKRETSDINEWRIDNEYNKLISELGGRKVVSATAMSTTSSHPLAMKSIPAMPPVAAAPKPLMKSTTSPYMLLSKQAVTGKQYIPPSGFPPGFAPP